MSDLDAYTPTHVCMCMTPDRMNDFTLFSFFLFSMIWLNDGSIDINSKIKKGKDCENRREMGLEEEERI